MEIKKGSMKKYCGRIELGRDFEVNRIIVDALIEKEYEVVSDPILDDRGFALSEIIDIYRVSERY